MEDLYIKQDDKEPWQKNILLAGIVLIMIFIGDAILYIPWKINYFIGKLLAKSNKLKKEQESQYDNNHLINHPIPDNFPATSSYFNRTN